METGDTLALTPVPGKDIDENNDETLTLNEKENELSEPNKLDESSNKTDDTKKSEEPEEREESPVETLKEPVENPSPLESTPDSSDEKPEVVEPETETASETEKKTETDPESEAGEPKTGKVDQIDQTDPTPSSTEIVRTLFVSGLPMDATPRELYLLFRSYKGFIESKLNTARNKYGKVLSPIGFVTFQSREDAEFALDELQDALFDPYLPNTTLRLEFAKSNSKIPSSSTSASTTVKDKDNKEVKEIKEKDIVEKESEKDKDKGKKQFSFIRNVHNNSGGSNTNSNTTTTTSSTSTPYYHPHHPNNVQQQQQQQQLHWPHGTASTNSNSNATSGNGLAAGNGTGTGINNPYSFSYYGTDFMGHFHQGSLPYGQSSSSILSVPSSTTTTAANSAPAQLSSTSGKGSRLNQVQNSLGQIQSLGHAAQNVNANPPSAAQPCSTLFIGNLGAFVSENELAQLFGNCPGFLGSRLYTKGMSPVAFVRFVDVRCASQAMAALQGSYLRYSDRGGIRIEYARSKMNDRDLELANANGLFMGYGNVNVNPYAYQSNCGDQQWTPYPLISQDAWIDNREPQQRQREWFPGLDRF